MPTIVTRGAASARGYGFAGVDLNLTTVTITSSTTWVAPVGVTNLVAVIGQGGNSGSDYQGGASFSDTSVSNAGSGSGGSSLPLSGAAMGGLATGSASVFNGGGYVSNATIQTRDFTFYPNNTFGSSNSYPAGTSGTYPYYFVAGTWSAQGGPYSGSLSYGDSGYWYAGGDIIYPGGSGGNTTGFGYTFSGASQVGSYPNASGQAATPVTYTNVTVSPGTGYTISVASGGSVIIQYLA